MQGDIKEEYKKVMRRYFIWKKMSCWSVTLSFFRVEQSVDKPEDTKAGLKGRCCTKMGGPIPSIVC